MPFDGQARIVAQQDFGRVYRFCGSSQLGERRRAYRKRLEMVGIHIKLFARPGQRSVILPEHVVAERVHGRPLIPGIIAAALRRHREQFDGVPVFAGHQMTHPKHATGAHIVWIEPDRPLGGIHRRLVMPFRRVHISENLKRKGRTGIEPDAALREAHRGIPHFARALDPPELDALDLDGGEIGARDRQRRIERDGFLEQPDRGFDVGLGLQVIVGQPLEEAIPCGDVVRRRAGRGRGLRPVDLGRDRRREAGGELVLHREQVAHVAVVAAGP